MFVVLGASGRAGGETARALMELGEPVRVVLRRPEQAEVWSRLGAEVAIASIEDVGGLASALHGATGAFLLSPPPVEGDPAARAEAIGVALAQAVGQAGLQRAVVLSSIGAQHATGTGVICTLHALEKHLRGAAPSLTFLRPGYFAETWSEVASAVIFDSVLPSFLDPVQKIPMVSTIDLGRSAAELLRSNVEGTRIVELRGPEDWSAEDVAAAFGMALGRTIETQFIPPDARGALLEQEGIPPQIASALLEMYDGIASGSVEHEEGREVRRGSCTLTEAVERIVKNLGVAAESRHIRDAS